jgi:hypothetical protein
MCRIYLASSWRNKHQPETLAALKAAGHEVYDFRNSPNGSGFAWSEIDPEWQAWRAADYRENLQHPRAQEGFASDFGAMKWADTCVLLLPSGRSAHLEAGWMAGAGKRVIVLTRDGEEPELMALLCDGIAISVEEVVKMLTIGTAAKGSDGRQFPFDAPIFDCEAREPPSEEQDNG